MLPEINQKKLVKTFLELVKINAVSLHERPVIDYIRQKLEEWGFAYYEDMAGTKLGGNAGNLIVPINGRGNLRLFLGAHTDTVRPTLGIHPKIENGIICSDGSTILGADNRAGVAILLYLLEQVAQNQLPHCSFDVAFTIAEEIGLLGAANLDWEKLNSDMGYIFDSSLLPGHYIAVTPTAIELNIDLIGKAAHAGVAPEKGINAISMAAEVLSQFPVGRVDDSTVANIGLIQGGEATNVIAAKVQMSGEIRSFSAQTMEQLVSNLQSSLDKVAQKYRGRYNFNHNIHFSGFTIPEDHFVTQRLTKKMQQVDLKPLPQIYHGGSDANVYNARGKMAINLGIGAKNPHGNDEHIAVADLVKMARLALALVEAE